MTLITNATRLPCIPNMTMSTSSPPGPPTHYKIQMQVVPTPVGDTTHLGYNDDEFSDFGADPEELAVIEQLLEEAAAKNQQSAIQTAPAASTVIDIEDYAAPQAVPLHQVLDLQSTQQWNHEAQTENRQLQSTLLQVVCDESGKPNTECRFPLPRALFWLT